MRPWLGWLPKICAPCSLLSRILPNDPSLLSFHLMLSIAIYYLCSQYLSSFWNDISCILFILSLHVLIELNICILSWAWIQNYDQFSIFILFPSHYMSSPSISFLPFPLHNIQVIYNSLNSQVSNLAYLYFQ